MKALLQPGHQSRLGRAQVNASHANLGESEFPAPSLNLGYQLTAIDGRTDALHPAIVKTLVWPDEAHTRRFATALAAQDAIRNCYVELHGELGAGKTTFARHLLHALGVSGRIKSPTYAIVEAYDAQPATDRSPAWPIWHFDFYRFSDQREWEDAGFRDIFASEGLKLAEWPQKAAAVLPLADLALFIDVLDDNRRQVRVLGQTKTGALLLKAAT